MRDETPQVSDFAVELRELLRRYEDADGAGMSGCMLGAVVLLAKADNICLRDVVDVLTKVWGNVERLTAS